MNLNILPDVSLHYTEYMVILYSSHIDLKIYHIRPTTTMFITMIKI